MPIIRRNNCTYATLGICHSVWMTVWYARRFHSTLHTRRSSTQSDKYQVWHEKVQINSLQYWVEFYTVQPLYIVLYGYFLFPCTFSTRTLVHLSYLSFNKPSKCILTSTVLVTSSPKPHTQFPRNSP